MQNRQDKTECVEQTDEKIVVISIGRHTRLGDILEYAVAGGSFETVDENDFSGRGWAKRRLLFAISADAAGENAQLQTLTAELNKNKGLLEGCVCAAIVDGAQGGAAHLDTLALLLAANQAGAFVLPRPLMEADRELRFFSGGTKSSFERYRAAARALVERLSAAEASAPEHPRVRFTTALEGGAAHDWNGFIATMVAAAGGELEDIIAPDTTILLCENTQGLPDDKTLSQLDAQGCLRLILASPATGSDLYTCAIIERTCLRGNYTLPPRAVLVFDGMSAVEVLASKRAVERVKGMFVK